MKILGISEFDNDASAAVLIDGKIIAAAGEERFTRVKQQDGFPKNAISYVLKEAKLTLDQIDKIAIAKKPAKEETNLYVNALNSFPWFSYKAPITRKILDLGVWYGRNVLRYRSYVHKQEKELKAWMKENTIPENKLTYFNHHYAHAATAYYFSGFEDALIVTCDGQGHGETATIYLGENGELTHIHSVKLPNSMGNFYGLVTKALGFKPNRHEGKITGLAAYKPPAVESDNFCKSIAYFNDGTIHTPYVYGSYPELKELIKKLGREPIAASFQKRLEEVLVEFVKYYIKKHPKKKVALAGGVFANVKLNQRIAEIGEVEEVFVFPGMADAGLSVGAAIAVEKKLQTLENVYLGPEFSEKEIEEELVKNDLKFEKVKNVPGEVAEKLMDGMVVGHFNGRMEFGPRALGNRSILYETVDPKVNDWLNESLERSEFMPFAPVTLDELAEECYVNVNKGRHTAKFMTMTFDCTEKMRKESPAVVHVDGTARPQLIDEKTNPVYYNILKSYNEGSGLSSLVNTSFNMHEEPIVCSPYDAVRAFKLGRIDALAIGNFIVENENGITAQRRKKA